MNNAQGNRLLDLLREVGCEPRAYSGRGMYGRDCVAVDVKHAGEALALGVKLALRAGMDADDRVLLANLGEPRRDSMGRDEIVYWSRVAWPE